MDVFALRDQLIEDYAAYIQSFVTISDARIREHVDRELRAGLLWPDPLLQLSPSFEPGPTIDDLVQRGTLHPLCGDIFRIKRPGEPSKPLRLHRHQAEAVEAGRSGDNYVLTTGTGSGKSLAYIIPIVDHVLRHGSGRGIQAIVVYPMNALANSQMKELAKFLGVGFPPDRPPVTFKRYTGQDPDAERQEILANPPDILLTNYVMLELLLTRPIERDIVRAACGLRFLVLDELHTYRGRQGADVALLVRRVREACQSPSMQCVGTSATLAGPGTLEDQQREIAAVATRLFGAPVKPERVIGETLRRATREQDLADRDFLARLRERLQDPNRVPPRDYEAFVTDPLSIWIESTFGVVTEPETGRLRRADPISITGKDGAARTLAEMTGIPEAQCVKAIQAALLAGYRVLDPDTGFPVFAFRLHQFITRGDTVYATLEPAAERHITTQAQQFAPGGRDRVLLPLAFCRECGQEYYVVRRQTSEEDGRVTYLPRELTDQTAEEGDELGFLYRSEAEPWPDDEEAMLARLPADWLEPNGAAGLRIRRDHRRRLPRLVRLNPLGQEDETGEAFHFVRSPFPFCLSCGVAYGSRQRSDIGKLASLAAGGRSTATTILSLSTIRALRRDETLEPTARKLLSFTDNRQDASLQAGHFNDFVEVSLLRAAIYQAALKAGPEGLRHDELPARVFDALKLPIELYAADPTVKYQARQATDRALREVLAYRIYQDLRRGWRVTAPNLEQSGLLEIRYASLDELCAADEEWRGLHPALASASPAERAEVSRTLLDFLRRSLAIKVDYLDAIYQERIQQASSQHLKEPWAIDEGEPMVTSSVAFPRSRTERDYGGHTFVSARGGFGLYLRSSSTFPNYREHLSVAATETIITQLFEVLHRAGLVEPVAEPTEAGGVPGYQVPASAMIWLAGDGTRPFRDPITVPREPKGGGRVNRFFADFYRHVAAGLQGIEAREHTAQVPNEDRQDREERFRRAELPVLYCSPTMELGVDIAELNVVNMRNVPPTPANYAQRSGRAGRSGQPALIFTYCTTGSPHDEYFSRRPDRMVRGAVAPPRLDLANEALVRAHVHAVWLAEAGLWLGSTLGDILDLSGTEPSLDLKPAVRQALQDPRAKEKARERLERIFASLREELAGADWYHPTWLQEALDQIETRFERACDRWRGLYRAAHKQAMAQHAVIMDASRSPHDKEQAKRLYGEAVSQMGLLTASEQRGLYQSDFYSYRYFASEGFLPGYSFPRLPLTAYIPGQRARNLRDGFLSRPRFLAISEFGPRSIIYHEGSRYIVNKVILPVGDDVLTTRAKLCPRCGYLHPLSGASAGPDICERCKAELGYPMQSLLRMQNVATKRRDRISCDEEERLRQGYEIVSGVRFESRGNQPACRQATVRNRAGEEIMRLTYGDAATIWRINLGWKRRRNKEVHGFVLDTERGYWASNEEAVEGDPADPMSAAVQRVIPFVEDHRNCLLIEPAGPLPVEVMASLQPALKNAIQARYQLEDSELAAEPLPTSGDRRLILLYESAEGGAGVLRQLVDDPQALGQVAAEALGICHFSRTGEDRHRAPRASEDCVAACYDCLMSYGNQPDHKLLDRAAVRDLLLELADARVEAGPGPIGRQEHLRRLKALCQSDLERQWLDLLEQHNLRLPDVAQPMIESCHTRPDFLYTDHRVAIYIDGPDHDQPDVAAHDAEVTEALMDQGYTVIRFRYTDVADWPAICDQHVYVFGTP